MDVSRIADIVKNRRHFVYGDSATSEYNQRANRNCFSLALFLALDRNRKLV